MRNGSARASGSVPWSSALVTGASSGIGEAITRRLAAAHVSRIVAVARRAERLDALATELREHHGVVVEVLAADLVQAEGRALVEQRLRDEREPIDLLVNNAGLGTSGPFVSLPVDGEQHEIDLNVTALVRLTRAVLPGMVDRGRGAVLNVSSMACYQPSPGMATYGATKAFVTSFSEALHEELRGSGVSVTALLPGYTRTEFQAHLGDTEYNAAPGFVWMSADAVAAEAVAAAAAGKALCIPGLGYKVAAGLLTPLPRSTRRWLMGRSSGSAAALAKRLRRE